MKNHSIFSEPVDSIVMETEAIDELNFDLNEEQDCPTTPRKARGVLNSTPKKLTSDSSMYIFTFSEN